MNRYAKFVDPGTGLIYVHMSASQATEFHEYTVALGSVIREVERKIILKDVTKALSTTHNGKAKTDYAFVTINFDPSKPFAECYKAAQKLGNRSIWEWSCWVHEQRSTTPEQAGHGHHVHLLVKVSKAATTARTKVKASMSTLCDTRNHHIFNWKWIPKEYILDKLAYMTQDKALEKQDKQIIDKSWRLDNNISPIYYRNASQERIQQEANSSPSGSPQGTLPP